MKIQFSRASEKIRSNFFSRFFEIETLANDFCKGTIVHRNKLFRTARNVLSCTPFPSLSTFSSRDLYVDQNLPKLAKIIKLSMFSIFNVLLSTVYNWCTKGFDRNHNWLSGGLHHKNIEIY